MVKTVIQPLPMLSLPLASCKLTSPVPVPLHGDHSPKPIVHSQAPVDEAKETIEGTNSTASISTLSSSPRAADDGTGPAAIHRLEAIMEQNRVEDRRRQAQLMMAAEQRHNQQMHMAAGGDDHKAAAPTGRVRCYFFGRLIY